MDKIRKKPGSLGKRKGTDALRRENDVVNEAVKRYSLTKKQRTKLHKDIGSNEFDFHTVMEIAEQISKKKYR